MTNENRNPQNLDEALASLRHEHVDDETVAAAGQRVWARMADSTALVENVEHIRSCEDIRALLPAYRTNSLVPARALLVEDHLHECVACRRVAQHSEDRSAAWSAPLDVRTGFGARAWAMAATVLLALGLSGWLVNYWFFAVPEGTRATVTAAEGGLFRVAAAGDQALAVGAELQEGEVVRTGPGAHAFLQMADGSVVEVNERTQLAIKLRRAGATVALDRGHIIVQAAKQRTGHLYVASGDVRVAVTGTIFSVNSGMAGSRVGVLEGEVRVEHGSNETVLQPGDQFVSSPGLETVPLDDEISWSRNREQYLALLAEFSTLQQKLQNVRMPELRYQSELLDLVPENAVAFATMPNYGEALRQGYDIFQAQLQQSSVLQQWWQATTSNHQAEFEKVISNLSGLSEYAGEEIVFFAASTPQGEGLPVVMTQPAKSGVREYLTQMFAELNKGKPVEDVHFYDAESIAGASGTRGLSILVRDDLIAASPDAGLLRALNEQIGAGATGFSQTPLGQRIVHSFSEGVGVLFAADIERLEAATEARQHKHRAGTRAVRGPRRASGFERLQYIFFERKDMGQKADNRAHITFRGHRTGIASWLAAPAPIGSLDFISADAHGVMAGVVKEPAQMFDDVFALTDAGDRRSLADTQTRLGLNIRDDLAASLGGDFAIALDGPVFPTVSWRAIVEVNDPARLQGALQRLLAAANEDNRKKGRPGWDLLEGQAYGRTFYSLQSQRTGFAAVHYTYSDGYLVAGPTRAMVIAALNTRASGISLPRSSRFRSLLPASPYANVSAVAYQNLVPVMQPLMQKMTAEEAKSLQAMAAAREPQLIAVYGRPASVEIASASKFPGFDFTSLAIFGLIGKDMQGNPATPNPY
jgi:hypothetical protein